MSPTQLFAKQSATSYLQNVVFVDDRIYTNGRPLEPGPVGKIKADLTSPPNFLEKEADQSSEEPDDSPSVETAVPAAEPDLYHPKELTESFAKKGIVCALYEPKRGFLTSTTSDLYLLCERADVVILDWNLYNDSGEGVTNLLAELITSSQATFPHHIRLCAIYTDEQNLHRVLDQLYRRLTGRNCEVDVEQGRLRLIAGATKICIFGKPRIAGRPEDSLAYEVREQDLAERIIDEFTSLHQGVLPAFALHGLAAIRRNTKRLLDKFGSEMDGAFLLHRALAKEDGDVFDQLPELLADEIRAVLEDTWPGRFVDISQIADDTINGLEIVDPPTSWKTDQGQDIDAKPILKSILGKGHAGFSDHKTCKEASDAAKMKGFRGINPKRLSDFEVMLKSGGKSWSEELAALFCNRTQYGDSTRILRFGTIVRHKAKEEDSWAFSICLMPICDSQRLDAGKQYVFPFWKLKETAKLGNSGKKSGVVIIDPEKNTHCLTAGGKIRDMFWLEKFTADSCEWVTATQNTGKFRFLTTEVIVEWVAELKPLHAQRIALYMGQEISRVGLVESEWLRLFCDR